MNPNPNLKTGYKIKTHLLSKEKNEKFWSFLEIPTWHDDIQTCLRSCHCWLLRRLCWRLHRRLSLSLVSLIPSLAQSWASSIWQQASRSLHWEIKVPNLSSELASGSSSTFSDTLNLAHLILKSCKVIAN